MAEYQVLMFLDIQHPVGYNKFDYRSGGVRVGRAEGGLMSLGGMEKDYRQEGGFVPHRRKRKSR